jgi:hypothetical protein
MGTPLAAFTRKKSTHLFPLPFFLPLALQPANQPLNLSINQSINQSQDPTATVHPTSEYIQL